MNIRNLSNEDIQRTCDEVKEILEQGKIKKEDRIRCVLSIEEVLLNYQEQFGEQGTFSINTHTRFGRIQVQIVIREREYNPLLSDVEEECSILGSIMASMGIVPVYTYEKSQNVIRYQLQQKKDSSFIQILVAILCGALCGVGSMVLPEGVQDTIRDAVLTPIFQTFLGFLGAIAGPMVFLSIVWGILGMGDLNLLGTVGKKMLLGFLKIFVIVSVITEGLLCVLFQVGIAQGGSTGTSGFTAIYKMILDIIPSNLIQPFLSNHLMQVIFLAVLFGVVLLILGRKASSVIKLVEHMNHIVQYLMKIMSILLPGFIFVSIWRVIMNKNYQTLSKAVTCIIIVLIGNTVLVAVLSLFTAKRIHEKPIEYIKNILPAILIGITTASSNAAFHTNVEICEKKLGIDKKITGFGIPIGQVMFMPCSTIMYLTVSICMAVTFHVAVTPVWLIQVFFMAIIISVAMPPIAGGALSCFTILFLQLGIPNEAIAIAVAMNIFTDFLDTSGNLGCLLCSLSLTAERLGLRKKG